MYDFCVLEFAPLYCSTQYFKYPPRTSDDHAPQLSIKGSSLCVRAATGLLGAVGTLGVVTQEC